MRVLFQFIFAAFVLSAAVHAQPANTEPAKDVEPRRETLFLDQKAVGELLERDPKAAVPALEQAARRVAEEMKDDPEKQATGLLALQVLLYGICEDYAASCRVFELITPPGDGQSRDSWDASRLTAAVAYHEIGQETRGRALMIELRDDTRIVLSARLVAACTLATSMADRPDDPADLETALRMTRDAQDHNSLLVLLTDRSLRSTDEAERQKLLTEAATVAAQADDPFAIVVFTLADQAGKRDESATKRRMDAYERFAVAKAGSRSEQLRRLLYVSGTALPDDPALADRAASDAETFAREWAGKGSLHQTLARAFRAASVRARGDDALLATYTGFDPQTRLKQRVRATPVPADHGLSLGFLAQAWRVPPRPQNAGLREPELEGDMWRCLKGLMDIERFETLAVNNPERAEAMVRRAAERAEKEFGEDPETLLTARAGLLILYLQLDATDPALDIFWKLRAEHDGLPERAWAYLQLAAASRLVDRRDARGVELATQAIESSTSRVDKRVAATLLLKGDSTIVESFESYRRFIDLFREQDLELALMLAMAASQGVRDVELRRRILRDAIDIASQAEDRRTRVLVLPMLSAGLPEAERKELVGKAYDGLMALEDDPATDQRVHDLLYIAVASRNDAPVFALKVAREAEEVARTRFGESAPLRVARDSVAKLLTARGDPEALKAYADANPDRRYAVQFHYGFDGDSAPEVRIRIEEDGSRQDR